MPSKSSLKELMQKEGMVVAPGCYDGLTAKLIRTLIMILFVIVSIPFALYLFVQSKLRRQGPQGAGAMGKLALVCQGHLGESAAVCRKAVVKVDLF